MLNLKTQPHFFLDDMLLAESDGLSFEINPPQKAGVVLAPDRPWEEYRILPNTILEDDGVFRMWYYATPCIETREGFVSCPRCSLRNDGRDVLCVKCGWPLLGEEGTNALFHNGYAESLDGIHWDRPELGLVEFRGSKANNIMPFDGRFYVPALNPLGGPEEKYMAISERGRQLYISTSPDGIHWKMKSKPMLPFSADTNNQIIYDPSLEKYVAYLRGFPGRRTTVRAEGDSLDQSPWPFQQDDRTPGTQGVTYIEDELPTVMDVDENDPPLSGLDIDHLSMSKYAEGVYVGFAGMFRKYPGPFDRQGREEHRFFAQGNDGTFEVQLAVSRDGRTWSRPDRRPYVNTGLWESPDGGIVLIAPNPISVGNEIYQYYGGSKTTHGIFSPGRDSCDSSIFRLVQTKDRFIGLTSGLRNGQFITKPFQHQGNALRLNADCGGLGQVAVELLDQGGQPIDGFAMDDCDPVDLNQLSACVTWRGKRDLSHLANTPMRLRMHLNRAKLYTLQFVKE